MSVMDSSNISQKHITEDQDKSKFFYILQDKANKLQEQSEAMMLDHEELELLRKIQDENK